MGVACIPHQLVSTFFESGLYEVGVNWPEGDGEGVPAN